MATMTVREARKIARRSAIMIQAAVTIRTGCDPQYLRVMKTDFLEQIAHLSPDEEILAELVDGDLWIN